MIKGWKNMMNEKRIFILFFLILFTSNQIFAQKISKENLRDPDVNRDFKIGAIIKGPSAEKLNYYQYLKNKSPEEIHGIVVPLSYYFNFNHLSLSENQLEKSIKKLKKNGVYAVMTFENGAPKVSQVRTEFTPLLKGENSVWRMEETNLLPDGYDQKIHKKILIDFYSKAAENQLPISVPIPSSIDQHLRKNIVSAIQTAIRTAISYGVPLSSLLQPSAGLTEYIDFLLSSIQDYSKQYYANRILKSKMRARHSKNSSDTTDNSNFTITISDADANAETTQFGSLDTKKNRFSFDIMMGNCNSNQLLKEIEIKKNVFYKTLVLFINNHHKIHHQLNETTSRPN